MKDVDDNFLPMISVLIPAYNAENFLIPCLDSIVQQTYQRLQVVVVDDGSSDRTLEIANTFADKYSCVEVYHQSNAGVAATRNRLINLVKGDYVLFVDSDDWIEYDMIESMVNSLTEQQTDIVVCGYIKEIDRESVLSPVVHSNYQISNSEDVIRAFLFHKELNGSLCNKLVPYIYFKDLKFDEDIWYGEDCLYFWKAINRGITKIYFMSDCFYHYRMNDDSISHENFNYKKMTGHRVWKQIYEDTLKKWRQFSELALASYAISDMWLLYFAAKSNYPYNKEIKVFQYNVRKNLSVIIKSKLINVKKIIFALIVSLNYSSARFFLNRSCKNEKK